MVPTDKPKATKTSVPVNDSGDPPVTLSTLPVPAAGDPGVLIPVTGADLSALNRTKAGRMMMNLGSLLLGLGLVFYGISRKQ